MTSLDVGNVVAERTFTVRRADLVRYCGASGDFNPIHWNERVARSVGLPNVIAHGMYTMALAGRAVTDWLGDPARLRDFAVRFTRPVPVPDDDDGAQVAIAVRVAEVGAEGRAGLVRVDIEATCGGGDVLGQAHAWVRPV